MEKKKTETGLVVTPAAALVAAYYVWVYVPKA